jgi:drug/metabolite transporter (DMT)-like permease
MCVVTTVSCGDLCIYQTVCRSFVTDLSLNLRVFVYVDVCVFLGVCMCICACVWQLIIPITLLGSFYMGDKFSHTQLYGCACILAGAIVASSGYLFLPHQSADNVDDMTTDTNGNDIDVDNTTSTMHGGMALPAAIILYLASVVPSAFSNIYKERRMKERDMNEYHTSSVVSFWQLWIGFAFLPLLSLPSLGTVCC